MIMNTTRPHDDRALDLKEILESKYDVPVLPLNCQEIQTEDIYNILEEVLYEFPIMEINIQMPKWIQALEKEHWLRKQFEEAVKDTVKDIKRLRDMEKTMEAFHTYDFRCCSTQRNEFRFRCSEVNMLKDLSFFKWV